MRIGIPQPSGRAEARLAATPAVVTRYIEMGCEVVVARGAGSAIHIADDAWRAAGAALVEPDEAWSTADLILTVARPTYREAKLLREGATIVCWLDGDEHEPIVERLAARKVNLIAMDAVPRTTRAQAMDVRSSMANLAGYRAVLEAASAFARTLGAQVTAAGSTPPATVLVIGAGVAGLAAIGAARGLGARVRAFDTRAAAREQAESLGATFLTVSLDESGEGTGGYAKEMSQAFIDAEFALFREQAPEVDIVITTALIPGRPAPKLWLEDMVAAMRPGSVVVDLAASRGGNCALTQPNKSVEHHGVTILGAVDLTQAMADHATRLLARNVFALVNEAGGADLRIDLSNDILRCATVLVGGELNWPTAPPEPSPSPAPTPKPAPASPPPPRPKPPTAVEQLPEAVKIGAIATTLVALVLIGTVAPTDFLRHLTVFVLACFVGWQVVWNVTPALHTPLMSVTNAISAIIVVGGLLQVASGSWLAASLGLAAIFFASINIFGGFAVTQRMLSMFRRDGGAA